MLLQVAVRDIGQLTEIEPSDVRRTEWFCRDRTYRAARRCIWPLLGQFPGSWPLAAVALVSCELATIRLYEGTLADCKRALGADHPYTLRSRNNLAIGYRAAGRTAEAIPLLARTLTDCERVPRADHPGHDSSARESGCLDGRAGKAQAHIGGRHSARRAWPTIRKVAS